MNLWPGRSIFDVDDAMRLAKRRMPHMMFDFVQGAVGTELAANLNCEALNRIRLCPRVLVNVDGRKLGKQFLDEDMGLPFGIAPMGMCNLVWPGADGILAEQAAKHNIPLGVSTAASSRLEDMIEQSGGKAWFQLYVYQSHEAAFDLVDRAAAAGYTKLLLTVDVTQLSRRVRDLRNGFQVPFKMGPRQFADFALHPTWSLKTLAMGVPSPQNYDALKGDADATRNANRGSADWNFLKRLRERWKHKLVVKGVLSPADAVQIKQIGADAVYVSNHGGRQLDSAPPAIQALGAVRSAVGPDYPLIFDSGVRSGEDVVKALAMGADFVMLGRPMLYAIGANGARGLNQLLEILKQDVDVALSQIGLTDISDVTAQMLYETSVAPTAK
ncbi:MAG: alpha-hydroxy-acid oxidizing protein [Rhizobiales bacterium]|nr:alpha-hydroxy-acid oxidizing protein [Hyphomicrobiales bacterium]